MGLLNSIWERGRGHGSVDVLEHGLLAIGIGTGIGIGIGIVYMVFSLLVLPSPFSSSLVLARPPRPPRSGTGRLRAHADVGRRLESPRLVRPLADAKLPAGLLERGLADSQPLRRLHQRHVEVLREHKRVQCHTVMVLALLLACLTAREDLACFLAAAACFARVAVQGWGGWMRPEGACERVRVP